VTKTVTSPAPAPARGRPVAVAAFLALAVGLVACRAPAPPRVSDVVLIVVDTLRADRLGVYGHRRPTSPEIDRWARRGVVFDQALSPAPWTLPAMASLLTGRWPSTHGAGSRVREANWAQTRSLGPELPTLAGELGRAGLRSAALVNNVFMAPALGLARGFATYDYRPAGVGRGRRAAQVVDAGLAWLDAQPREARVFLLVHLFDPHLPYEAPPPHAGRFTAAFEATPLRPAQPQDVRRRRGTLSEGEMAFVSAAYDEEIAATDEQVGRLLDALDARGRLARALVLLTADHGEELFDHGSFEHGHSTYQEVLRVPFVAWAPGLRARRVAAPVSLVDVMPTLLDAAGAAPVRSDGRSLWPLLVREARPGPRALAAEGTLHRPERRALLRWPLKLVTDEEQGRRELYDLERDPGERHDLAVRRPADTARLVAQLERLLAARPTPASAAGALSPEELEELRALGYVGP
jgi:arylsulfatase A-like enzyme